MPPPHIGRGLIVAALLTASLLALAGCGKKAEPAPEVRPVRLMQLSPHNGKTAFEFSGDVRPRVESRLGFRVGGKIAARLVDVGAVVSKGQPLARLDPTDLALAEAGSRAQFEAAKTDRDLAAADLKRYNDLFARGFISAAEQHRRQANYDAAESRLRQAQAGLRSQSNQTGYSVLHADATAWSRRSMRGGPGGDAWPAGGARGADGREGSRHRPARRPGRPAARHYRRDHPYLG